MKRNVITTTLLLAFPTLALANGDSLPTVEVYSAYATPINQDKTASSVTVLTEKDFAERNATYVSDVLKTVPSMAFSASGGRGTLSNFYLRGADANHTAVVIDGVKVNPVSGFGFDFGGLSLSHVERIEVLRGEQSALWGSDAMGGVIYITTKKGLYKDQGFNLDVDLGAGSNRTRDGSVTLSGYHNGFYYALNGNSHKTQGISAYSTDKFHYTDEQGQKILSGGAVEKDKFHRDNASLRFGYAGDNRGIDILASHASQTARYDGSLAGEKSFDDRTRVRDTLFKLSGYVGNEQELFKHQASISHLKTDSDTFSAWASAFDAKKLNANYQLDINFDREGAITQSLSLLGEYQRADYRSTAYPTAKHLIEQSAAAEYRLFSEEGHSFSLSGRYTDSSTYKDSFTGRMSGAYRFSPNLKAHASFGSAIQNPTMTEVYGWDGKFIGNPNLKPEKSLGGDVGLTLESKDKRHQFDLTYFARNVADFISTKTTGMYPNSVSHSINLDGKTKIKGIELAYNGKITDVITAYANYSYTYTRDSQGLPLLRRPKQSANAGVAYQITEKLGTNLSLSYVGKRIDSYYNETTYTSSRVKLPSYTLTNIGANYQLTKNLNVYAQLNNLFDKKYEHTVGYGQFGRNVYVGLKGAF